MNFKNEMLVFATKYFLKRMRKTITNKGELIKWPIKRCNNNKNQNLKYNFYLESQNGFQKIAPLFPSDGSSI